MQLCDEDGGLPLPAALGAEDEAPGVDSTAKLLCDGFDALRTLSEDLRSELEAEAEAQRTRLLAAMASEQQAHLRVLEELAEKQRKLTEQREEELHRSLEHAASMLVEQVEAATQVLAQCRTTPPAAPTATPASALSYHALSYHRASTATPASTLASTIATPVSLSTSTPASSHAAASLAAPAPSPQATATPPSTTDAAEGASRAEDASTPDEMPPWLQSAQTILEGSGAGGSTPSTGTPRRASPLIHPASTPSPQPAPMTERPGPEDPLPLATRDRRVRALVSSWRRVLVVLVLVAALLLLKCTAPLALPGSGGVVDVRSRPWSAPRCGTSFAAAETSLQIVARGTADAAGMNGPVIERAHPPRKSRERSLAAMLVRAGRWYAREWAAWSDVQYRFQ